MCVPCARVFPCACVRRVFLCAHVCSVCVCTSVTCHVFGPVHCHSSCRSALSHRGRDAEGVRPPRCPSATHGRPMPTGISGNPQLLSVSSLLSFPRTLHMGHTVQPCGTGFSHSASLEGLPRVTFDGKTPHVRCSAPTGPDAQRCRLQVLTGMPVVSWGCPLDRYLRLPGRGERRLGQARAVITWPAAGPGLALGLRVPGQASPAPRSCPCLASARRRPAHVLCNPEAPGRVWESGLQSWLSMSPLLPNPGRGSSIQEARSAFSSFPDSPAFSKPSRWLNT